MGKTWYSFIFTFNSLIGRLGKGKFTIPALDPYAGNYEKKDVHTYNEKTQSKLPLVKFQCEAFKTNTRFTTKQAEVFRRA